MAVAKRNLILSIRIDEGVETKEWIQEWGDILDQNHRDYAEKIGCDYKMHGYDSEWEEFRDQYKIPVYHAINMYKFYLMEKYSHIYDNILFADLDVAFFTDENIFEVFDFSKGLHATWRWEYDKAIRELKRSEDYILAPLAPSVKMIQAWAMTYSWLTIPNTGLFGACADDIRRLNYIARLPGLIASTDALQDDPMFTDQVKESFQYNNEVFCAILAEDMAQVEIPEEWNLLEKAMTEEEYKNKERKVVHFIMKHFEWEDKLCQ